MNIEEEMKAGCINHTLVPNEPILWICGPTMTVNGNTVYGQFVYRKDALNDPVKVYTWARNYSAKEKTVEAFELLNKMDKHPSHADRFLSEYVSLKKEFN